MVEQDLTEVRYATRAYTLLEGTGMVAVDIVKGFCKPGAGNLAPPMSDPIIEQMVANADTALSRALAHGYPVLVLRDSHQPGRLEVPFPPHCEQGSGEDELVQELCWLTGRLGVTDLPKDCFNGVIGGVDLRTGRNVVIDWVNQHQLKRLVVMGICTDICVMQFVQTMLSVKNHGMMTSLQDIIVYEPGCATYDLPRATARRLGLPDTAAHPRELFHRMGLMFMAQSGAIIAKELTM